MPCLAAALACAPRAGASRLYPPSARYTVAFGTDLLADWESSVAYDNDANQEFVWLTKFMPNVDALRMATGNTGELHALSGPNSPYQDGPTGVIQEGAYADLLLVDGNPLKDIKIMTQPGKKFRITKRDPNLRKRKSGGHL